MKKHTKLIEKVLFILLLTAMGITGIKAQQKVSPSALSIRDGVNGNEYSQEDWIDIYTSDDVVGGKNSKGYVYYITKGGIKLWEPPSSFQADFWKKLNTVAKCQNWTLDGVAFVPEAKMDNLSWREIITDYCVIDYDPWKKDEVKVFGWSHNTDQKNSKIVPSPRASHPKEGKLCFNTENFQKVNAPSELIPLRSTRCTNPLEKKFEYQKKQKVSQVQNQTPMVVYTPTSNYSGSQTTTFVYERPREQPQPPPQQSETRVTSTSFNLSVGFSGGGYSQPVYQTVYQSQPIYPQPEQPYFPQQPTPQPIWNNPNPTLGNGYFDNGGPIQGGGGFPVSGGPAQGNGTFPVNGGLFQGDSGFNNGGPISGNSGFNNGGPMSGNSGVSTGGPIQGGGGNPTLGNGPR